MRAHPTWLFKVHHGGAIVDVLHVAEFVVKFDDDILRKSAEVDLDGVRLPFASAEDLAVIQGSATRELYYARGDGITVPDRAFEP